MTIPIICDTIIYDEDGTKLVTYTYDAWGNCTVSYPNNGSSSTAIYNPFRYRGYYLDTETGFYYLNSRYYDPAIGRFITADKFSTIKATPLDLTDKNLYSYCDNNPVTRRDDGGEFWISALKVVAGVAAQYISDVVQNVVNGETGWEVLKPTSSIGEYVSAGVTALIPGSGIASALARSVISEGIQSVENKIVAGEEVNLGESLVSVAQNTLLDFSFSQSADWVDSKICKLEPRNYSSYARTVRNKNPTATRAQIAKKMGFRTKSIRTFREASSFTFSVTNSIFS